MHLLEAANFQHRERAMANLSNLARYLPSELLLRIASLVKASADGDSALHFLTRFHQTKPQEFIRLVANPSLMLPLVTVFANSRFLSDEVIQHPDWLEATVLDGDLHRLLPAEALEARLGSYLARYSGGIPTALQLAQFRRLQILRILLRDVSGLCTLAEATEELSNLADAILQVTYRYLREDLEQKHGTPYVRAADGVRERCEFSVLALGKLGGQELNYSSDVDLMFVYTGSGETDGPKPVSNQEFFKKLANRYTELLSTYTSEGMCYRVDLRLRPDGRLGEVCISLEGARHYYANRARDWELQMLIKARVAAGENGPGEALLAFVEPSIYSTTLDFSAVEAVSATRERIQEKLKQRKSSPGEVDVKLARGGIRDIEFLVQCLQRLHGGREPWVRHGGTLLALFRLRDKNLLSDVEYSRLCSAYEFLRHLEHRLQVDEDRQTHLLPSDRETLEVLARRMPATELGAAPTPGTLLGRLNEHLEDVREIYERVIHSQKPIYYSGIPTAPRYDRPEGTGAERLETLDSNLVRFLDQKAPHLAQVVGKAQLRRGSKAFERYLEWVVPHSDWLYWLDSDAVLAGYLLDLFELSPHLSEQLIRFPDLLEELRTTRQRPGNDQSLREALHIEDPNDLRRFFRRQMFRIQAESVVLSAPVFTTLERTTALADAALQCAYRMAVNEVRLSHPPAGDDYEPAGQMMVIALGRLGMREFDLGSDADLLFVLPDEEAAEHQFWTRVAARMIDRVSAYTREGFMFTIDTRLRPNGREGELVQLESSYKDYFTSRAEAWEGISYMKSRSVAGQTDRATRFLNELQEVDWRRYGQSGRSQKELRHMRLRLEREQGAENPLKAGFGGYYDIDFALMYLRLKGAGIFFKVLNTPERIDVIEKMGHLERADAAFLRDAAGLYRAIDHGLRVLTGHAEGTLPKSTALRDSLTALVSRWTPDHLHDQPLESEVAQIRERTREFFDRLFAAA